MDQLRNILIAILGFFAPKRTSDDFISQAALRDIWSREQNRYLQGR